VRRPDTPRCWFQVGDVSLHKVRTNRSPIAAAWALMLRRPVCFGPTVISTTSKEASASNNASKIFLYPLRTAGRRATQRLRREYDNRVAEERKRREEERRSRQARDKRIRKRREAEGRQNAKVKVEEERKERCESQTGSSRTTYTKETCHHRAWWDKVESGAVCSRCSILTRRFTFKCPDCGAEQITLVYLF
jgi:hypothetical protein